MLCFKSPLFSWKVHVFPPSPWHGRLEITGNGWAYFIYDLDHVAKLPDPDVPQIFQ